MTLTPIPDGHVGAVVTYLEMTERPKPMPLPASPLRLKSWPDIRPAHYRELFRRLCGRWLWFPRLDMDDAALVASLGDVQAELDMAGVGVGPIGPGLPGLPERQSAVPGL